MADSCRSHHWCKWQFGWCVHEFCARRLFWKHIDFFHYRILNTRIPKREFSFTLYGSIRYNFSLMQSQAAFCIFITDYFGVFWPVGWDSIDMVVSLTWGALLILFTLLTSRYLKEKSIHICTKFQFHHVRKKSLYLAVESVQLTVLTINFHERKSKSNDICSVVNTSIVNMKGVYQASGLLIAEEHWSITKTWTGKGPELHHPRSITLSYGIVAFILFHFGLTWCGAIRFLPRTRCFI